MRLRNIFFVAASMVIMLWPAHHSRAAEVTLEFFYGIGCPHCAKVEPFIEDLVKRYPAIDFKSYEVYGSQDNARLLLRRYSEYGAPSQRGVPVVFIGDHMVLGDTPIIDTLENIIIAELAKVNRPLAPETEATPAQVTQVNPETQEAKAASGPAAEQAIAKSYTLLAITGAAVVDSINPCAIAVLLILLTALMVGAGDKKRALKGGLAFVTSIYITYFLFGLGLLQLIAFTNLAGIIAKLVGVVAITIGLANIKDFIAYGGGGFVMEIPRRWRPTLKKLLNGVTSPLGAFLAGFAVTFFELPCTGGPYFFVLGLLAQAKSLTSVLPVLLYYNLVFILPLLVIVALVYFGFSSVERAEAWKERNIRMLHLVGGIIMLALGLWIFMI